MRKQSKGIATVECGNCHWKGQDYELVASSEPVLFDEYSMNYTCACPKCGHTEFVARMSAKSMKGWVVSQGNG